MFALDFVLLNAQYIGEVLAKRDFANVALWIWSAAADRVLIFHLQAPKRVMQEALLLEGVI